MRSLYIVKSDFLKDTGAFVASDTIHSGVLLSGVEQTVTVPALAEFVLFNADGDFYANYDTTAAIPSGSITAAGGEKSPAIRSLDEVIDIHLIAEIDTKITMAFYSK